MTPELAAQIAADDTYQRLVRPAIFLDAAPVAEPELVMVAGPPGIGKTDVMDECVPAVAQRTGANPIVLDADGLRKYVSDYDASRYRPQTMIARTAPHVERWMGYASAEARAAGHSVVVQRAMRAPSWSIEELSVFKRAGYRVILAAIAGLQAESRLGIVSRYLHAVQTKGMGRSVPENVHQEAWANLRPAMIAAVHTGDVDVLEIWERIQPTAFGAEPLAAVENGRLDRTGLCGGLMVFDGRRESMPSVMSEAWLTFYDHVAAMAAQSRSHREGRMAIDEVEESLTLLRADAAALRQSA